VPSLRELAAAALLTLTLAGCAGVTDGQANATPSTPPNSLGVVVTTDNHIRLANQPLFTKPGQPSVSVAIQASSNHGDGNYVSLAIRSRDSTTGNIVLPTIILRPQGVGDFAGNGNALLPPCKFEILLNGSPTGSYIIVKTAPTPAKSASSNTH
jgi:hypothetical protein